MAYLYQCFLFNLPQVKFFGVFWIVGSLMFSRTSWFLMVLWFLPMHISSVLKHHSITSSHLTNQIKIEKTNGVVFSKKNFILITSSFLQGNKTGLFLI